MPALESVPIGRLPFERFESVLPAERYAQFRDAVERSRRLFEGRAVWNVNSTSRGGGVAEMLVSLLAYAHGAGVDARWIVISGNDPFFALTKRIHNNLHNAPGDGGDLGEEERRIYDETLKPNIEEFMELVVRRRRRHRARPPAGRADPAAQGARDPGHLALPRRDRHSERCVAARLELPAPVRRAGRRLRLLPQGLRLGGPRRRQDQPDRSGHRRVLGQEPGARPRDRASPSCTPRG